jgi:hypothetical protein
VNGHVMYASDHVLSSGDCGMVCRTINLARR